MGSAFGVSDGAFGGAGTSGAAGFPPDPPWADLADFGFLCFGVLPPSITFSDINRLETVGVGLAPCDIQYFNLSGFSIFSLVTGL